ncbi:hypothetical protein EI613_24740 [Azospirillum sp. 412522]|nr:hypothetical protein [Azospirillum sp. 412522]MBY6265102.1 hypothetical protein [Azospirillum sp. 412522]
MNIKRRKNRNQKRKPQEKGLLRSLDPHYDQRLPDHYFTAMELPGAPTRYLSLQIDGDGVTHHLKVTFPEGSRPKIAIIQATRDVFVYDVFSRLLVPEKFHIETYRKRQSGSSKIKFTSIVPGFSTQITANTGHIFEKCDAVVSIDTNTKTERIGDDYISVLGISTSRLSPLSYPKLVHINAQNAIEFRNLVPPREKIGWIVALREMYRQEMLKEDWNVCVVVDAYQSEVMEFNNGGEIFSDVGIGNISFPKGLKLAYASAETGQLYAINRCVKAADRLSDVVYEKILEEERLHAIPHIGGDLPYSAIRFWSIDDDGKSITGFIPE